MSTITHMPARDLQPNDILIDGASVVSVDLVKVDDLDDDVYWIDVTCISGNFDQYETPIRAGAGDSWQVLNAAL